MPRVLKIAQLTQAAGVSAKTIRSYEQVGVLPPRIVLAGAFLLNLGSARSKWTSSRRGSHEPALGYASPTLCRARNPASTMVDALGGGATPPLP